MKSSLCGASKMYTHKHIHYESHALHTAEHSNNNKPHILSNGLKLYIGLCIYAYFSRSIPFSLKSVCLCIHHSPHTHICDVVPDVRYERERDMCAPRCCWCSENIYKALIINAMNFPDLITIIFHSSSWQCGSVQRTSQPKISEWRERLGKKCEK